MKAKVNNKQRLSLAKRIYFYNLFFSVFWCIFLWNISDMENESNYTIANESIKSKFRHPIAAIKVENEFKIKRNDN